MNQITNIIFNVLPGVGDWSSSVLLKALEENEIKIEDFSFKKRFMYSDELDFDVVFQLSPNKEKITSVELAAKIDQDEGGWSTWSKENEMNRLDLQKDWMKLRGISEVSEGNKRVSCCFSPQDGASAIHLTKV